MELTLRQLEIIRAINAGGHGKPESVLVEQFGASVWDDLDQLTELEVVEVRRVEPLRATDSGRIASPVGPAYYALTDLGISLL